MRGVKGQHRVSVPLPRIARGRTQILRSVRPLDVMCPTDPAHASCFTFAHAQAMPIGRVIGSVCARSYGGIDAIVDECLAATCCDGRHVADRVALLHELELVAATRLIKVITRRWR